MVRVANKKKQEKKEVRESDIKISQIDKRTLVEVNGEKLPEIFCGYQVNNSNSEESELALVIRGNISVSELSARIIK